MMRTPWNIETARKFYSDEGGAWHVDNSGYASRHISGEKGKEKMHRLVLNAKQGELVDHINHDKLDNRKCNLRIVTQSQNSKNISIRLDSRFGYKGVTLTGSGRYAARIGVDMERIYLGIFDTSEDAAKAYNIAAKKYHGEFANLNKIEGEYTCD